MNNRKLLETVDIVQARAYLDTEISVVMDIGVNFNHVPDEVPYGADEDEDEEDSRESTNADPAIEALRGIFSQLGRTLGWAIQDFHRADWTYRWYTVKVSGRRLAIGKLVHELRNNHAGSVWLSAREYEKLHTDGRFANIFGKALNDWGPYYEE